MTFLFTQVDALLVVNTQAMQIFYFLFFIFASVNGFSNRRDESRILCLDRDNQILIKEITTRGEHFKIALH